MAKLKNIIKRIFRKSDAINYPHSLRTTVKPVRGLALLSYLGETVLWRDDNPKLSTHSAFWKCKEIANLLLEFGYDVDSIDYSDSIFVPRKNYDILIDIDSNLQRLAPFLPEGCKKILMLTGSYGPYQHQAELARVARFEERTGCYYSPKRLVRSVELAERSLEISECCILVGNETTKSTYPAKYHDKIDTVCSPASPLLRKKNLDEIESCGKEFLWFFGAGAVHKGLDIVVDYFIAHPEYTLNVVGKYASEMDFMLAYGDRLKSPNIKSLGYISPGTPEFFEKLKNVYCFIAPSCSEGMSPSVLTCMEFGLFPIVSRHCGVDLPQEAGLFLNDLSTDSIAQGIEKLLSLPENEVVRQTLACQELATNAYSRSVFRDKFREFLTTNIGEIDARVA